MHGGRQARRETGRRSDKTRTETDTDSSGCVPETVVWIMTYGHCSGGLLLLLLAVEVVLLGKGIQPAISRSRLGLTVAWNYGLSPLPVVDDVCARVRNPPRRGRSASRSRIPDQVMQEMEWGLASLRSTVRASAEAIATPTLLC